VRKVSEIADSVVRQANFDRIDDRISSERLGEIKDFAERIKFTLNREEVSVARIDGILSKEQTASLLKVLTTPENGAVAVRPAGYFEKYLRSLDRLAIRSLT
jgi:hypothetical protein